jgi:hypothetical protein
MEFQLITVTMIFVQSRSAEVVERQFVNLEGTGSLAVD